MAQQLKNLLHSILNTQDDWKIQLLSNWPSIIGNLHTKVKIEKIKGDILVLGVYDSCWLQELYLLSSVLLKTINAKLDQPRIKQLRFKKIGIQKRKKVKKVERQRRTYKKVSPTLKEQKALEKIEDPQLSAALKDFLVRCYQEK